MMVQSMLRAGAWPAVIGVSGAAVVVGGCGAAFPAAATVLFPIAFTLLAAAAAFTLDEPASQVVDVTPTGPARRTAIRSLALLAPLAAGAVLMLASALRGLALPWAGPGSRWPATCCSDSPRRAWPARGPENRARRPPPPSC